MLKCRLKEMVKERNTNLNQVAIAINYRHNTIYSLAENELKYVDKELIVRLCSYFNCQIEDLFYLDDSNEN
ncbi:helix-turn-helix transcriptional regulator [Paenibacillus melissococcoides]|uniref:Helix-turn-helix transcriptional regulator n=1 Tax=Paenibacillus melissococcoides TaxID=2912268 RepID=A0ABM9G9Y3_9BACL|nr:helix-turn-helix transcriptional regulator [Paenibacillus melissococcoides]CAH8248491.1 helix-turn-helix transcriptional regulator [Paenibacillus melissococcoides]CAH8722076.1 helix-turn-helix transcriptional regulator [Paenibacillus melissococcoides]CAH8722103.1 helix-turn-helix transcriptional regulator [Paenibacillus melissococcoides]